MLLTVPLTLFLGAWVVMLVRFRVVSAFVAIIVASFGFLLASSFLAGPIQSGLSWITHTNPPASTTPGPGVVGPGGPAVQFPHGYAAPDERAARVVFLDRKGTDV